MADDTEKEISVRKKMIKTEKDETKKNVSEIPREKELSPQEENRGMEPEETALPVLPVSGVLVFPYALTPLVIEGETSISIVTKASEGNRLVVLLPEMPPKNELPEGLDIKMKTAKVGDHAYSVVAVIARIVKILKFPDGTVRILVRGISRCFLQSLNMTERMAVVRRIDPEAPHKDVETVATVKNAVKQFQRLVNDSPALPDELKIAILNITDQTRVVDLIADTLNISYAEKLAILVEETLSERLQFLTILLNREVEVQKISSEIQSQVHNAMSKSQREFFLREQLRTIKEELGEDSRNPDIGVFEERLKKLKAPEVVISTVKKEIDRLAMIPPVAGEYTVSYNYIDWILSLPWDTYSEDRLDVKEASAILDRDHYGLKDVKERILEFLSVLQLKKDGKSPILCFAGPPGVGKTSLGKSIAEAMGRKFVRISLGGIHDEAEIRGHRRTYIGALPGRIVQGLKKAGTSNPVFMLDEIDKIGKDFRGDPSSALLEVLDPQQNCTFNDHYLELDYDLSNVMFIATANILETIPGPLLDRMDVIRLPGYTPFEKRQIALQYLVPRQIEENGLASKNISMPVKAVDLVINSYTREAGVRNLERTIGSAMRKVARSVVEGSFNEKKDRVITPEHVKKYLGAAKYLEDEIPYKPEIGTVTGMAWTSVGGVLLQIQAIRMPGGRGELKLTGSLGDVMKESAITAFSYVRSRAEDLGIDPAVFQKNDFHIHVPDGATPKDGPSAGVTISTALVSLLTNLPAKNRIAMTGEINLRGCITAIGGLKEKVIAALQTGIRDVIAPLENKKDMEEMPEEVKKNLKFHFVETAEQAWKLMIPKIHIIEP